MTDTMGWQDICARKVAQRDAGIPVAWKLKDVSNLRGSSNLLHFPDKCSILKPREIEITTVYDAVDLVQKIAQGVYSAVEVTTAFCKRAAVAHSLVNCLTETFFNEAIDLAAQLDEERAANPGKPLRPLHGLPISMKDSFKIRGKDATIGLVYFANSPATSNAVMVDYLISLGAIPFCKTNVSQTMMTADSDNNIWGRTLNPSNINLTAGGSTGGEGALIALRGSILGIGTDVAGNIRIPSLCNGIYGLKPSADITPWSGQQSPVRPGIPGVTPSAGPMATSARACRFFMETIMRGNLSDVDSSCIYVRWAGAALRSKSLKIGVMANDGIYTTTPPMRRGLGESVLKLKNAGMICVPVMILGIGAMMQDIWDLYSLDGAKFVYDLIAASGEPVTLSVERTGLISTPPKTMEQLNDLNARRVAARKEIHKIWKEHDLDCILTLPAPHTAVPLDAWKAITYTALWNYLDYPAAVIPVGRVVASDVKDDWDTYGEEDAEVYSLYSDPKDYENAPIAVQLVGMRQRDEDLANMMEYVDEILKR